APGQLCVTEAGGPVRCFDLRSGAARWHHTPPRGAHVVQLSPAASGSGFQGIQFHFERGSRAYLVRFYERQAAERVVRRPSSGVGFFGQGANLVLPTGQVLAANTGRRKTPFTFLEVADSAPRA